jgi:hypothetical protein
VGKSMLSESSVTLNAAGFSFIYVLGSRHVYLLLGSDSTVKVLRHQRITLFHYNLGLASLWKMLHFAVCFMKLH